MALIQEEWYLEGCIRGLNIPGYTLCPIGGKDRPRAMYPCKEHEFMGAVGFLLQGPGGSPSQIL
jgi:hypothetical protein